MKVLITGLGSIGNRHARILQDDFRNVDIVAYRSGYSKRGNQFDIPEYTSLKQALHTDPDVAFITNSTHKHIDTALRCARAGCHLFIEKPLSHTLEGVDQLIAEANERNLITHVGSQLRFDPILNRVKHMISEEQLGKVISYRAIASSYLPDWRPNQDYRESYSADPDRGGGVVLDLIHEIDYTSWLFGTPSDVNFRIGYTDTLEIETEAIAEAIFLNGDDIIGNIHLDYCRRQPRRTLEVICEMGTIIADLEEGKLKVEYPSSEEISSFDYDRDQRFKTQLDYFIDRVQSKKQSDISLREGKEVLETALKIKGEYDV